MPEAIVREAFQTQAQACDALGSPFTAGSAGCLPKSWTARKAPLPTPSSHGPARPVPATIPCRCAPPVACMRWFVQTGSAR